MLKKVKLHALERLDLVDINAMQDNQYEYLAKTLGNFVGEASGLLQIPTESNIVVDNSTDLITFPDFVFLESISDSDYATAFEDRVITFDASQSYNGTCSFDSVKATVQAYYDANGTIPPTTDDQYYPFIWVRKTNEDSAQGVRRFWSVANANETTDTVDTRQEYGVEFLLSHQDQVGYTKIGKINLWLVLVNTVILPLQAGGLEWYTFADSVYFSDGTYTLDNSPDFNTAGGGGLKTALRTIRKQIEHIRGDGQVDSTYGTINTDFNVRPLLSLDGLYDRTVGIETELRNRPEIGSFVITLTCRTGSSGTHGLSTDIYTNSNRNYVDTNPSAEIDYSFLYNQDATIFPLDFSDNGDFGNSQFQNWISATSLLAVTLDSTDNNKGLLVNADVSSTLDNTFEFYNMNAFVYKDPTLTNDHLLRVKDQEYRTSTGGEVTFYGFKLGLNGLSNILTQSNLTSGDVVLKIRVNYQLIP